MQELGITSEKLPGIDITATVQRGIGDYGKMDAQARAAELQADFDRSGINSRKNKGLLPRASGINRKQIKTFTTPQG